MQKFTVRFPRNYFWFFLLSGFVMPLATVHARTVGSLIADIKSIVGDLVPLFIGLSLVYFIYGLAQYINVSGEAAKKEEGRTRMVWGTLAMFVIISVWGLVILLQNTIFPGGDGLGAPPTPKF